MEKVYRGLLVNVNNGEEDDIIGIRDDTNQTKIIADELRWIHRKRVTIYYYISSVPLSRDQMDYELAKICIGFAEANYEMVYTEYTGYIWTTELLKVGGHDLIEELGSHIGKYLHLVVDTGGTGKELDN